MTSQTLAQAIEEFLAGSSAAVVVEDGGIIFDLSQAKFSVSGDTNKCVLHFWSDERNVVRRVLDVESKGDTLRIAVQKMGHARPSKLEISRQRDRRTSSSKRAARVTYHRLLERVLRRNFADLVLAELITAIDFENLLGQSTLAGSCAADSLHLRYSA